MPRMGRFKDGQNKGKDYEVYADPASRTGYTRKIWDRYDTSSGGKPTEYFEDFNQSAAEVDDEREQQATAARQAALQQRQAKAAQSAAQSAAIRDAQLKSNERVWNEDKRRYDEGRTLQRDQFNEGVRTADRDFDLKNLDTRSRLKIALAELKLKESGQASDDLRARERNVLDYTQAIGKLRLPYVELQALARRAVAGIVPGAAGPAGGSGAGGGALTADQWAALSQGVVRQAENNTIGQGNPLAG